MDSAIVASEYVQSNLVQNPVLGDSDVVVECRGASNLSMVGNPKRCPEVCRI